MMEFKERNTLSLTPTLSQRERGGPALVFKACAERFPHPKGKGKGGSAPVFKASAERFPHPKGEGERRTGTDIQR